MAREIKFQVMDNTSKEILGYEHFNTTLNDGYYYVDLSEPEEERVCHTNYSDQPMLKAKNHPMATLIRRQFTGCKDKNGVEIYDGDILSGESRVFGDVIGGVEISKYGDCEEYMHQYHLGWNVCGIPLVDLTNDGLEVIGNIHENPELLEGQC